jgi:hypothetical protein
MSYTRRAGAAGWHVSRTATRHERNRDSPLVGTKATPLRNGQATLDSSFYITSFSSLLGFYNLSGPSRLFSSVWVTKNN